MIPFYLGMCVLVYTTYIQMILEARKVLCQIPWSWSSGFLWTACCVLNPVL